MLDLDLRAPDDVVDAVSDVLYLVLAVQVTFDGLIGFDEVLELLLKAVVLIVQICHVFVEGVDLLLKVSLVAQHLVGVLLEAVDFEGDGLLVLLKLAEGDLKLLAIEATVLADNILVLVSFEELTLRGLMLLIQTFEIAEFAVQLVQRILKVLDVGVSVSDFDQNGLQVVFLVGDNALHGGEALIVVLEVCTHDIHLLRERVDVTIEGVTTISQAAELAVVGVVDLLLVGDHGFNMLNLLSDVQIDHVDRTDLVAQINQLVVGRLNLLLGPND
jgi:hypothetical protein